MSKNKKSNEQKSFFKNFLKYYVILLVIFTGSAAFYVYSTLKLYEHNQIENYMNGVMGNIKECAANNEIEKYITNIDVEKNEFENDVNITLLNDLIKGSENITYKLSDKSKDEINPIYDIFIDGNKVLEIILDGTDIETRLSLLTFSKWKVDEINVNADDGFYTLKLTVPGDCDVFVNDTLISKDYITVSSLSDELSEVSKYVEIPHTNEYVVKGFLNKPIVRVVDKNGQVIDMNKLNTENEVKNYNSFEEAKADYETLPDIMKIAEDWSLFLSNDLNGKTNGFYNINKYIVKDSYLYNYAYKWATNVDITFISNHTLKTPAFTNETMSNFVFYGDKAFSCDVYLEKNMRIANGTDLVDKMNEKLFFAYYDDTENNIVDPSWKLVKMQSITDGSK